MKNPTIQELMEYLDGTLHPVRYQEIDQCISTSPSLQREIALLKAMQQSVRNDISVSPSRKFTSRVMKEILPIKEESFWLRAIKNSSNLFAMVLVLSMIGIVLVSSPSATSESSALTRGFESYSTAYNSALETVSLWTKQYMRPVNQAVETPSGKFIMMGLVAFFIFMLVDEFFGNQQFHSRLKQ